MREIVVLCSMAVLAVPLAAHGGDGRLEIHQACVATGCFPGDAPGLPVTITARGSYVLTSNLTGSGAGAITASVAGVELDLNGFEIVGPGSCSATLGQDGKLVSVSCNGTDGTGVAGIASVRNGTIRGFAFGIQPPEGATVRIERMTVRETSYAAILASGRRTIVSDCIISTNAADGISGQDSTSSLTVRSCIFERNDQGIYLADGVVTESIFIENAEALRSNVGGSGLVVNCSFSRNVTALGGSGPRYRSNVFEDTTNALGGTNLGSNTCNGVVCP